MYGFRIYRHKYLNKKIKDKIWHADDHFHVHVHVYNVTKSLILLLLLMFQLLCPEGLPTGKENPLKAVKLHSVFFIRDTVKF